MEHAIARDTLSTPGFAPGSVSAYLGIPTQGLSHPLGSSFRGQDCALRSWTQKSSPRLKDNHPANTCPSPAKPPMQVRNCTCFHLTLSFQKGSQNPGWNPLPTDINTLTPAPWPQLHPGSALTPTWPPTTAMKAGGAPLKDSPQHDLADTQPSKKPLLLSTVRIHYLFSIHYVPGTALRALHGMTSESSVT